MRKIIPGIFNNDKIIVEIDLSHNNNLKYIKKDSFNNSRLREIYLNNCNLETIHSNTFSNLPELIYINLSYNNNLKNIEKDSFNGCQNLEYIEANNCNLQIIKSDILNYEINLDDNNLIYNCRIDENGSFNNNYLNNERHIFLTDLRSKFINNNNNNSLKSHWSCRIYVSYHNLNKINKNIFKIFLFICIFIIIINIVYELYFLLSIIYKID